LACVLEAVLTAAGLRLCPGAVCSHRQGCGDVVSRLNSVVGTAPAEPAIQETLRKLGNTPAASSPAAVRTLIADTIAKGRR
jgi:hypothetical protein